MYRVLAAYEKYRGPLGNVRKGVLVCLWLVTLISIRDCFPLTFFLHKNLYVVSNFYFYLFILMKQVSMARGTITAHSLMSLEARGILFVSPGLDVRTI